MQLDLLRQKLYIEGQAFTPLMDNLAVTVQFKKKRLVSMMLQLFYPLTNLDLSKKGGVQIKHCIGRGMRV